MILMKKQPILLICAARLFFAKKENSIPTKISAAEYTRQKDNERLMLSFIRMALSKLDGVYVKNVTYIKNDNLITVDVLINNEERQVYVVI